MNNHLPKWPSFTILLSWTYYFCPLLEPLHSISISLEISIIGRKEANPTPLFGSLKDLFLQRDSMGGFLMKEYEKHADQPYFGLFSIDKPAFVVRDLDVAKNILVKDFEVFQNRSISVDEQTDPLNAKGIIVQKGKKWRYIRMKLTPTFSSNKIKNMFCLVDAKAAELAEFVEQQSLKGNTISVKDISSGYTIDVLASCAFGVNANAINDGNGEFPKILRKIFEMKTIAIIKQTLVVFLPSLANFLKLKVSENVVDDFVRKTLWDVVGHREKNEIKRQDFVDLLMQLRNGETFLEQTINDGTKVADQQERRSITNNNDVFLIAGFHTSANTTSFALYELATQPDMQTRLRQEILDVLDKHGGKITHDALTEMTYLDMVVSETLRKYPILPFLDRMTLRDYKIPGTSIVLEKGTSIFIPLLGFHNDPKYFPNPKKFNPERFTLDKQEEHSKLRLYAIWRGAKKMYEIWPDNRQDGLSPPSLQVRGPALPTNAHSAGLGQNRCNADNIGYPTFSIHCFHLFTGNTIPVKEITAGYTIDVLASCAFGVNANAIVDRKAEFHEILRQIFELNTIDLIKTTVAFFLPWSVKYLKLKLTNDHVDNFVRKTLWDVVAHREKTGLVREDFVHLLMKLRKGGEVQEETKNDATEVADQQDSTDMTNKNNVLDFKLEDDDYAAQAHSFLLAGYHTTANTMGFALFELATHPNLQTRLQKEIISVLNKHGGEVTHDSLWEMTYLDMVISETLRKYPILPFLDRRTLRDYKVPGTNVFLEKGTTVFIPLLGLHNDPKYFPSPNEFNPERFTLENRKSIPNYAYMPFGEGPRKCIGMRFGLMKVKIGLVHLLSKFEVRPCQQTKIPLVVDKTGMMMTTEDSMPLTFNRFKT
uniref:(California timema) hypothetical protein n=1 Tax=Timema californicum TaxID=61474 RepID=A0A7R9J2F8_TIMCA|nr:unnamed protein product [Timema californicum]